MRPEQRQRLAVLVDTAIVKVGLIGHNLPCSSAVEVWLRYAFLRYSHLGRCPALCPMSYFGQNPAVAEHFLA